MDVSKSSAYHFPSILFSFSLPSILHLKVFTDIIGTKAIRCQLKQIGMEQMYNSNLFNVGRDTQYTLEHMKTNHSGPPM